MGALHLLVALVRVLADLILVNSTIIGNRTLPPHVPVDLILVKDTSPGE